jgi:hypothetical protein
MSTKSLVSRGKFLTVIVMGLAGSLVFLLWTLLVTIFAKEKDSIIDDLKLGSIPEAHADVAAGTSIGGTDPGRPSPSCSCAGSCSFF